MIKAKVVEIHAFSARRISDGKQSGVNESSLDDRKIYGRDGWAERAGIAHDSGLVTLDPAASKSTLDMTTTPPHNRR